MHLRLQDQRACAVEGLKLVGEDRGVHLLRRQALARPLRGRRCCACIGAGLAGLRPGDGAAPARVRRRAAARPSPAASRREAARSSAGCRAAGLARPGRIAARRAPARRRDRGRRGGRGLEKVIRRRLLTRRWRRGLPGMLLQHILDQRFEGVGLGERGVRARSAKGMRSQRQGEAQCATVLSRALLDSTPSAGMRLRVRPYSAIPAFASRHRRVPLGRL